MFLRTDEVDFVFFVGDNPGKKAVVLRLAQKAIQ